LKYPGTSAKTLARDQSDHVPYVINIKTEVPRARIFQFKNYLMDHSNFQQIFQEAWNSSQNRPDPAMNITAKLKATRKTLKDWQKDLPKLATTIENTKLVIQLIDLMEEHRDLEIHE
jgi:hypothetical protein